MKQISEEQMWEVIDGLATPDIMQQHEKLMLQSPEYKAEFQKYAFMDEQLLKLDLEVPSMRFTENVLDNVLSLKKATPRTDKTPLFFMLFMGALSALVVWMIFSTPTTSTMPALTVNTEGVTSILSNPIWAYGFLIFNIILFFVILDKKVLKPYFDKRLK